MKSLTLILGLFFSLSATEAGLGFNPFDKNSPTSSTPQNSKPVSPSSNPAQPKPPTIPAATPVRSDNTAANKAQQPVKK